jgi:hypothetical protein
MMMSEDIGEFRVEGVKADLTNQGFDKDGNLTLTFTVDRKDKWRAAPITDIRARAFELDIKTCGTRVFLAPGGLELARQRVVEALGADDGD